MESTVMEKPCDVCERERARWFCAADNASLCNRCDAYVHSANAVARRHERKPIAAPKSATNGFLFGSPGYRRRARSSRTRPQRKEKVEAEAELATVAVPEHDLGNDDEFLPQVPVFVPALAEELCEFRTRDLGEKFYQDNCEPVVVPESDLHQFLNSDTETDLFALDMEGMDVESIIGQGLGDEGLGFLGFQNSNFNVKVEDADRSPDYVQHEEAAADVDVGSKVKVEVADQPEFDPEGDQSWDTIEINLDYHDHDEDQEMKFANSEGEDTKQQGFKFDLDLASILGASEKKISLNLNYEDVLMAWSDRGSLWVSYEECASDGGGGFGNSLEAGLVPDLGLNCAQFGNKPHMINGAGDQDSSRQRGREARVLRYREKRRTRLFSKKIRYEVRKLNAEKRPRMKGRFVKRMSGMASD